MKITDTMVLFWGDGDFLSNFYPARFTVKSVRYLHTEQFLMAEKARAFKDEETLAKILAEPVPYKCKKLGRQVQGYNESVWSNIRRERFYPGLLAKFEQNTDLWYLLKGTGDRVLVEASPYDGVWGIKLGEDDPHALDPAQWRGANLLGDMLMDVRTELMENSINGAPFNWGWNA